VLGKQIKNLQGTYIHTYIRMIHTYDCTYIHIYVYTYIYTYIHTYIRIYIHTYVCVCVYTQTYTHTYLCIHLHIYVCIRIYVPTYVCIHPLGQVTWISGFKNGIGRSISKCLIYDVVTLMFIIYIIYKLTCL